MAILDDLHSKNRRQIMKLHTTIAYENRHGAKCSTSSGATRFELTRYPEFPDLESGVAYRQTSPHISASPHSAESTIPVR